MSKNRRSAGPETSGPAPAGRDDDTGAAPAGEDPVGQPTDQGSAASTPGSEDGAPEVVLEGEIVEGDLPGGDTEADGAVTGDGADGDADAAAADQAHCDEDRADQGKRPAASGETSEEPPSATAGDRVVGTAKPVEGTVADEAGADDSPTSVREQLEERTADLIRVMAEYSNYRKRVDRDRAIATDTATGAVLQALLPVLDDCDRAREHGDLVGPFASVAEQLNSSLAKFGLVAFGSKGDSFDPARHEAVAHVTSGEVSEPTCVEVLRRGYMLGERLLRPAMVVVADAA